MILNNYEVCRYKDCPYRVVGNELCYGMREERDTKFYCNFIDFKGNIKTNNEVMGHKRGQNVPLLV